jgi:hypothetical protein
MVEAVVATAKVSGQKNVQLYSLPEKISPAISPFSFE